MKRFVLHFLLFLAPVQLYALSLGVGLDAAAVLSPLYQDLAVEGECGLVLDESFRTTLSLGWFDTLDAGDDVQYLSLRLSADYFPFDNLGFYIGISLADLYFPFGLDSDGEVRISTFLRAGYAWRLPFFTLDARLSIRDISSAAAADSLYLSGKFGQLGRFSLSCLLSFRYDFKTKGDNP